MTKTGTAKGTRIEDEGVNEGENEGEDEDEDEDNLRTHILLSPSR